jgi:hypothetical protein
METNGASTKKPTREILRATLLGSLAAALAVIFDQGRGIYGLPRLTVLVASSFFWWSLLANVSGRQNLWALLLQEKELKCKPN